jgi:hypothetical protein
MPVTRELLQDFKEKLEHELKQMGYPQSQVKIVMDQHKIEMIKVGLLDLDDLRNRLPLHTVMLNETYQFNDGAKTRIDTIEFFPVPDEPSSDHVQVVGSVQPGTSFCSLVAPMLLGGVIVICLALAWSFVRSPA